MDDALTPEQVAADFFARMNDLAGVHGMAYFASTELLPPWLQEAYSRLTDPTPESSLFMGGGTDPNVDGTAHLRWYHRDMPRHLDSDNGTVMRALGQQWLVIVAAEWNDNFRKKFATANGLETKEELTSPGLADMNRMRNDVIHHRGIASERNVGRCEVFKWFRVGDVIQPGMAHVADFMSYLGQLHDLPAIADEGGAWEKRGTV